MTSIRFDLERAKEMTTTTMAEWRWGEKTRHTDSAIQIVKSIRAEVVKRTIVANCRSPVTSQSTHLYVLSFFTVNLLFLDSSGAQQIGQWRECEGCVQLQYCQYAHYTAQHKHTSADEWHLSGEQQLNEQSYGDFIVVITAPQWTRQDSSATSAVVPLHHSLFAW